ncbi:MAG: type II secretion system protein [Planctomycetes bacterium]|nr:type II secretion system protein [Planctomycetota bacterium]
MTTLINNKKDNKLGFALSAGFTLFELIVVLAVISAIVGVALPYATKSNHVLNMRQDALNIAETFKYGIDLAQSRNRKIKISINPKNRTYRLLKENNDKQYEPLEGYFGIGRRFNKDISVANIEGLTYLADEWCLVIDPAKVFPDASLELRSKDIIVKITITGRKVAVEETSI